MSRRRLDHFSNNWHKLERICLIFENCLIDRWKSLVMDQYHPDFQQTTHGSESNTLGRFSRVYFVTAETETFAYEMVNENNSFVPHGWCREAEDQSWRLFSHLIITSGAPIVLEQDVFVYSDSIFVIFLVDMYLCKRLAVNIDETWGRWGTDRVSLLVGIDNNAFLPSSSSIYVFLIRLYVEQPTKNIPARQKHPESRSRKEFFYSFIFPRSLSSRLLCCVCVRSVSSSLANEALLTQLKYALTNISLECFLYPNG